MEHSPNLQLPYLAPAQAQKHVTHNEAIRMLDVVTQLGVVDRTSAVPPASPSDGARHIVSAGATGAWAGRDGQIAAWLDGGWEFFAPRPGWRAYVADEQSIVVYDGSDWIEIADTLRSLQNLSLLGIGTEADAVNPFAARTNKALWTARYASEGGDGDLRYTMNKQATGNTLSLMMQSNWSGRAEIGLVGSDDLALRVSADGIGWKNGLRLDKSTGSVSFPSGIVHAESGLPTRGIIFTPGGDGQVSIWRLDVSHVQNPRTAAISSVSGDTITLAAADVPLFGRWTGMMSGVAFVRIWNISKSPAQSAWLTASPTSTTLQVRQASSIAGWTGGETLQIGDPLATTPGRVVAIDISPVMIALCGAAFRQSGVVVKSHISGASGDGLSLSANGISGSFISVATTGAGDGTTLVPTTELSPISNSNLLFLRETVAGAATLELVSIVALVA